MARPDVHAHTERLYARSIPAVYRDADAGQPDGPNSYPLLRFLDLMGAQAGDLEDLIARIDYVPLEDGGPPGGTSDLVDPATADAAWLPWLAQLVGVLLRPASTEAEQRDAIAGASTGWQAGTRPGLEALVASVLTGTKHVDTIPNYGGDPWVIGLRTIPAETPDPAAVVAAILAADAKPAAFELVQVNYVASWDIIEATYPTWADLEAAGSWDVIESTV